MKNWIIKMLNTMRVRNVKVWIRLFKYVWKDTQNHLLANPLSFSVFARNEWQLYNKPLKILVKKFVRKTFIFKEQSLHRYRSHILTAVNMLFIFTGPCQRSTESSERWSSVNNAIKLHTFYLSDSNSSPSVTKPSGTCFCLLLPNSHFFSLFLWFRNPPANCHWFKANL